MPELPEVETVRRSLLVGLVGRRIADVRVRDVRLRRRVDPHALRAMVRGRQVEAVLRRGKYLVVCLEGDRRLLLHLGMSGRLLMLRATDPQAPHEHVVFELEGGEQLRFRDHRRFGIVEAMLAADLEADRRMTALGVEPLSRACNARYLRERARGLRRPVKNFIMDARQVVGVGNIYACESLFVAGVHPQRPAGRLSPERWELLTRAVKLVLRRAIRRGGTTLNDFRDPSGAAGWFQLDLRVYGRDGEPCRHCGRSILKKVLAGRSTFYCPGCQR